MSGFWPSTLNDWLVVAGVVAGAVYSIWKYVKQPIMDAVKAVRVDMMDEINKVGERLNEHVGEARENVGRLAAVERRTEMHSIDQTNLHESLSRLTSEVQTLTKLQQKAEVDHAKERGEINSKLIEITTILTERQKNG